MELRHDTLVGSPERNQHFRNIQERQFIKKNPHLLLDFTQGCGILLKVRSLKSAQPSLTLKRPERI